MDASEVNAVEACARVLLVEDDERLAELIGEYLGRNGMDLHWVRRGDVAIEKTYAIAPDLVVLDVMLPGLGGFEICRELRARGATLPILILTARDEDFDRVLGADEFIAKPVDLTTSEFDVLWLLARHAGKVLSRNDILQELRSLDYDGSDRSVDCRIYRLRRKLGDLADSAERIKTIRNVGYLFSPTPPGSPGRWSGCS